MENDPGRTGSGKPDRKPLAATSLALCVALVVGFSGLPAAKGSASGLKTRSYALSDRFVREALLSHAKGEDRRAAQQMQSARIPRHARKYLASRYLMLAGDVKKATRGFLALAGDDSPLKRHAAFWAGTLLLSSGKNRDAIAWLRVALDQPGVRAQAALSLSHALRKSKRNSEARGMLEEVVWTVADPEARRRLQLELADSALEAGDPFHARLMLQQLRLSSGVASGEAGKRLEAMDAKAYRELEFLQALLRGGTTQLADLLARFPADAQDPETLSRRALIQGVMARNRRRHQEAVDWFKQADKDSLPGMLQSSIWYFEGRSLEALDHDLQALDRYREVLEVHPDFPLNRRILVRCATIGFREGEVASAQVDLDRFLATSFPGEDQAEGLWLAGFASFLSGDFEAAAAHFESLSSRYFFFDRSIWEFYGPMGRFWAAQAHGEEGDRQAQERLLAPLRAEGWGSYYSLLALRLGDEGVLSVSDSHGAEHRVSPLQLPETLALSSHYQTAMELFRLGLYEESFGEAMERVGTGQWETGAVELMASSWFRTHALSRSVDFRRRTGLLPPPWRNGARLWTASLPLDFVSELAEASRESEVPMSLLAAVVRFESRFHPEAVSGAGAVGLIQVKPGTGRAVGNGCLKLSRTVTRKTLMDPSINLRIGAILLRELLRRHHGSYPVALASFNAGSGTVKWWLSRFAGLHTSEFVEQMTYPGTVGYLKRILACVLPYWSLYHPLLGDEPPRMTLPETIPETLAPFLMEEGGGCRGQ